MGLRAGKLGDLPPAAAPAAARPAAGVVARNTAFAIAGQIGIKLFGFVFGVFIVRRLGDADFGRYSAALAYVGLFAMLTDLGTSSLSVRELARRPASAASMVPDLISLRAALSVIVTIAITASAWALGKPPEMVLAIGLASINLFAYALYGPFEALMIAREQLGYTALLNLLNQSIFIVLGTVALLGGAGYVGLVVASAVGTAVIGLVSTGVARRALRFRFERADPRRWLALLRGGLPFGITGLAGELHRRFDTVFMSFVLTDAAVGWYNVSYNLLLGALVIAQSLGLSVFPSMVRAHDSGRGSIAGTIKPALRYLLLVAVPITVGGTLLADRIVVVLYGEAFRPAITLLQIMLWSLPPLFLLELIGRVGATLHLERRFAWLMVAHALVSVALIVVFVRRFGVTGAAVTLIVSRLLLIGLATWAIGSKLLWAGAGRPLARIIGAALAMALMVGAAQRIVPGTGFLGLLVLIAIGTLTYAVAALRLGAVTVGELRAIADSMRRRLAPE